MLSLSRSLDETIIIGDDIKVRITSINGRYVNLGVEAPDDVLVLREELSNKHQQEKYDGLVHREAEKQCNIGDAQ